MSTRRAGKNQLFWGIIYLSSKISAVAYLIRHIEVPVYVTAILVFSLFMLVFKTIDWESVREI